MTAVFCIKITNRQSIQLSTVGFVLVRVVGLEPTRLTAEEPKSSESTISTIPADMSGRDTCSYFVVLCFYTARETVAERNA